MYSAMFVYGSAFFDTSRSKVQKAPETTTKHSSFYEPGFWSQDVILTVSFDSCADYDLHVIFYDAINQKAGRIPRGIL